MPHKGIVRVKSNTEYKTFSTEPGIEQRIIFSLKEKRETAESFPSQKMSSEKNRTTLQEETQVLGKHDLLLLFFQYVKQIRAKGGACVVGMEEDERRINGIPGHGPPLCHVYG